MNRTLLGLGLIIVCAVIEGLAQIAWKTASVRPDRSRLWIGLGVVAYGTEIALYTLALTLGSLSFVSVAILSRLLLGERISWMRGAGLLLILTGVALMGGEA